MRGPATKSNIERALADIMTRYEPRPYITDLNQDPHMVASNLRNIANCDVICFSPFQR